MPVTDGMQACDHRDIDHLILEYEVFSWVCEA